MNPRSKILIALLLAGGAVAATALGASVAATDRKGQPADRTQGMGSIQATTSAVIFYANGDYAITSPGVRGTVIRSDVEADVDARVLRSSA
jgi:hypothetical protein